MDSSRAFDNTDAVLLCSSAASLVPPIFGRTPYIRWENFICNVIYLSRTDLLSRHPTTSANCL